MDETQATSPTDEPRPLAGVDAASAPTRPGFTLRGRKWIYGATLAAAGVLAGSGITYAVVSSTPTVQTQAVQQGGTGSGPGAGGRMGTPPDGQRGPASDGTGQPS